MLPDNPTNNQGYDAWVHPKLSRQISLAHEPGVVDVSNLYHLLVSKLSIDSLLSTWESLGILTGTILCAGRPSAFFPHVVHIVLMRSFEQVRPIATPSEVALVKHPKRGRIFPVMKKIGNSVRREQCGVFRDQIKDPISFTRYSRSPRPAFVGTAHGNLLPKTGDITFGKRREWLTIGDRHLASLIGLLLVALRGDNHAGPCSIVCQEGI